MGERRAAFGALAATVTDPGAAATVVDQFGRPLRELRLSVTDRCNFRCRYCMPAELFASGFRFRPRSELLSFEEIARLVRVFAGLGVRKVRLTGGEPLLRRDLPGLVGQLAAIPGLEVVLTTNGSLLLELARPLRAAGLHRVSLSLDSLDGRVLRAMTGVAFPVARVLDGIAAAEAAGFRPLKINAVVRRGVNDHCVVELARRFRGTGHVVRFIEYMDVGTTGDWRPDHVVPASELLRRLRTDGELVPVAPAYPGEVARRWRWADGSGEVGFVTSVSQPFCRDCTRARLSADGRLYTCLFASAGADLARAVRGGESDGVLAERIRDAWRERDDRYSETRGRTQLPSAGLVTPFVGG